VCCPPLLLTPPSRELSPLHLWFSKHLGKYLWRKGKEESRGEGGRRGKDPPCDWHRIELPEDFTAAEAVRRGAHRCRMSDIVRRDKIQMVSDLQ
jgi:hypothetical protein